MINRKIIFSALSILASLSLMGGATFAYFNDTATSTTNTFASGTLKLKLDDNNEETPAQTVTASFGSSSMVPGSSTTGFVSLHNDGTIDINKIKLSATQTNNTNNGDDSNLADVMDLTIKIGDDSTCATGATDLTSTIETALGGSLPLTLSQLNGQTYNALPGLTAGSTKYLCVTSTFDQNAGNTYQGDSITETFSFEGDQNAGQ